MAFSDQDILNFISNLNEKSLIDQASLVAMKVDNEDSNSNSETESETSPQVRRPNSYNNV